MNLLIVIGLMLYLTGGCLIATGMYKRSVQLTEQMLERSRLRLERHEKSLAAQAIEFNKNLTRLRDGVYD